MEIGITPLYGIGDTLLYTPAVRVLKETFPDYRITAFTFFPTTRDILKNNPFIDEIVYYPMLKAGKLKTLLFLKRYMKKFDVMINFYPSNRREYNLFAFLLFPSRIIGHKYRRSTIKEFNFVKNWLIEEDYSLHVVEENLNLLKFFGIDFPRKYGLQLFLDEQELKRGKRYVNKYNDTLKVGIHPGTSSFKNHEKRRWPPEKFIEFGKFLRNANKEATLFIFGGPEENGLKEFIKKGLEGILRVVTVNTKNIRETAAIIKFMDIFVTNDSGLMHIAAALKLPVVAIFGPTNPVWVRPWGTKHRIVRLGLECSPCFYYSPKPLSCPAGLDFKCLKALDAEMVFNEFIDLLHEVKRGLKKLERQKKI